MKLIPVHRSCFCAALMAAVGFLAMAAPLRSQIASRTTGAADCRPSFPYKEGWLGGDAAYSISLAPGQSLWLFGDTLVGKPSARDRKAANFVRNSIALSTCDRAHGWQINYYWKNKNRSKPTAFFDANEKEYWYWPLDGFLYRGRLYLATSKLKNKPNEGVFSFETVGVYLAVVSNPSAPPDQWQVQYLKLSEGSALYPGSTIVLDGEFANLFTVEETTKPEKRQHMILNRLSLARLDRGDVSLEYFARDKSWKPGITGADAAVVIETGHSEMSVRYHAEAKQWVAVSGGDFLSNQIMIRTAPALTGPWSEQRAVYEFPEMSKNNPRRDRDTFCYAVKEHIEFAEANRMLVTYACNSFKLEKLFANTDIYRPQTVLVQLPSQKG